MPKTVVQGGRNDKFAKRGEQPRLRCNDNERSRQRADDDEPDGFGLSVLLRELRFCLHVGLVEVFGHHLL